MNNSKLAETSKKQVDIDSILRFVKQSIFSKRREFFDKLESLANAHLDDKSLRLRWPDALTVLTDDDWIEATLSISDSVALAGGETRDDDPARWLLRWLNNRGGLGFEKHGLIDAVLEGRAYVRNDQLCTDGPTPLPAPKARDGKETGARPGVGVEVASEGEQCPALDEPQQHNFAPETTDLMTKDHCIYCGRRKKAGACQHDLQKPNTTVEVDGERNGKCTVCKTEWTV